MSLPVAAKLPAADVGTATGESKRRGVTRGVPRADLPALPFVGVDGAIGPSPAVAVDAVTVTGAVCCICCCICCCRRWNARNC